MEIVEYSEATTRLWSRRQTKTELQYNFCANFLYYYGGKDSTECWCKELALCL